MELKLLILKKAIFLFLILKCGIGLSQNKVPFFEQIAFDFYRTEILVQNPVKKKIKVYSKIRPSKLTEDLYWYPRCLKKFKTEEYDNSKHNVSNKSELNLNNINKTKFKIKKYGKGTYPKLYVSQSLLFSHNRILVRIEERYKWEGNYYYIELDSDGKVTDWCKGGYLI